VEGRCHATECERDLYRLLAHRWQSRLQDLLRRNTSNENQVETHDDDMEAALDVFLSERHQTRALAVDR
jgi:hypothetical protein